MKRVFGAGLVVLALGACSPPANQAAAPGGAAETETIVPVTTEAPAGTYVLEKSHASLIFRVDHLGFSMYTARFKNFDAELEFDPADPAAMRVTASVDANSLETDYPFPEQHDFNATLRGPDWLSAEAHPTMTFRSTSVALTGPSTAKVAGDFTMRGVTKPLVLDVRFNGGYIGHPMDPNARIGFSATGSLARSDYGMTYGIPAAGSKMGVGDTVEILLEVEFTGPPLPERTPPSP